VTAGAVQSAAPGAAAATGGRGEGEREYRKLIRKWWFAAAIGAPTMVLSYPQIFPLPRRLAAEGERAAAGRLGADGAGALAVLVYSSSQFLFGAREALRHRQANMHMLIAIGTGVASCQMGMLRGRLIVEAAQP
jgi:Cu+-exporting ATPase